MPRACHVVKEYFTITMLTDFIQFAHQQLMGLAPNFHPVVTGEKLSINSMCWYLCYTCKSRSFGSLHHSPQIHIYCFLMQHTHGVITT